MENASPVKLGIIGAGHIGSRHGLHAARLATATVTAVADTQKDKAEILAEKLGATAFGSVTDLLQTDVDAVIVAVPTFQHKELVLAALAAGKHILCEKPFALSLEDCDAMIAAAETAQKKLMVGQVVRFFPEYANAKRQLDSNAIGSVAAVRTRRAGRYPTNPWFTDPALSGGMVVDLLVHDFDFLLWCFGPVTRVYARTIREMPQLDYALVTLRHASGVIAHVEGVWGEPGGTQATFEIAGDGGMLVHDSRQTDTLRIATPDGNGKVTFAAPMAPQDDPYYRQLSAFVDCVRKDTLPAVTAWEARQAIAVALAAQESAKTGRAIVLEEANG